jgi:hypothetical protein
VTAEVTGVPTTGVTSEVTGVQTTGVTAEVTGVPTETETAKSIGLHPTEGITGVATEVSSADNGQDGSGSEDDEEDSGAETRHDEIPEDEVYHPVSVKPPIQQTCGRRPRKPRDYSHMYAHATGMNHAMTQYSLKKGFKKFQKVDEDAISK